jgi:hypothetical protein
LERYSYWIGNTSIGTGNGAVGATTYSLGVSSIKSGWAGSAGTVGQFGGVNSVVRGGGCNTTTSCDASAYLANVFVSQTNNFVAQYEGKSGYAPNGSFNASLRQLDAQIGPMRNVDNPGIGYYIVAQAGALGAAFEATNDVSSAACPAFTCPGSWTNFLRYVYSDGTHAAYDAFKVKGDGTIYLSHEPTTGTTPAKSLNIDSAGNLIIYNNAGNAAFYFTDGGDFVPTNTIIVGTTGTHKGTVGVRGNTSGTVTIAPQADAGTYNFNLPIAAGSSGNVLTSAGGGAAPMTWTTATTTINGTACTLGSTCSMGSPITNSLVAPVAMNNTANYFPGPSVAQGTTGTWLAMGTVTMSDTAGGATFDCKLWDGTTVIASQTTKTAIANEFHAAALSGFLASPADNIRISCKDVTSTSGVIQNDAADSTINASTVSAIRIQ